MEIFLQIFLSLESSFHISIILRHVQGKMFAGIANGTIAYFRRKVGMLWTELINLRRHASTTFTYELSHFKFLQALFIQICILPSITFSFSCRHIFSDMRSHIISIISYQQFTYSRQKKLR